MTKEDTKYREDIINMALEAGFLSSDDSCGIYAESDFDREICIEEYAVGEQVARFAELEAAREREDCAKVCEDWPNGPEEVYSIGQAIRPRGSNT